jgi:hypothetical protein
MPAMKTAAMPKVAGMARSYVPARTTRQERDFSYKPGTSPGEASTALWHGHKVFRTNPPPQTKEALTTKNSVTAPIPRIEFVA